MPDPSNSPSLLQATVPSSAAGRRLDAVLAELFPQYSRSRLSAWIKSGDVTVDGASPRGRDSVHGGEAIALSVQRTFGRTVQVQVQDDGPARLLLPEVESIPIALTLNELLTNAVKHSPMGDVFCQLACEGGELRVAMRNAGRLREGFDAARISGGVSGLGLVRALLPRRSASFTLTQHGGEVLTEVRLRPPSVQRDDA